MSRLKKIKLTPFARKVYNVVLTIPLGEVRTYKWVAEKAGVPKACRAVGQVLKRNPYTILIPCHRVVGSQQGLGGYSKGLGKKRMLLKLEKDLKECLGSRK